MAFRLVDIKKTVRARGDGERYLHPRFLDGAAMAGAVDLALAYFDARLGRKRRDFEPEMLVRFFGDPKVARGIVDCLGTVYCWRTQYFADALKPRELLRLGLRNIRTASDLRLYLFDLVDQVAAGFLAGEHEDRLQEHARRLGIAPAKLDQLFALDAEENAVLVRVGDTPEAAHIVAEYNFRLVHAVLRNCELLEFPAPTPEASAALVEACRSNGVQTEEERGTLRLQNRPDALGSYARWGHWLARATYEAASTHPALLTGGRARVRTGGRPAWYLFDRRTLSALTGHTGLVRCAAALPELRNVWPRGKTASGTPGWRLTIKAEPFVSRAGLIVPRHAVQRGERRVVLWPVQTRADGETVRALHEDGTPVLAIHLPGAPTPSSPDLVVADYAGGADGILSALGARWGEGRVDAAAQALQGLMCELEVRGFLPSSHVADALGCSSYEELPGMLRTLDPRQATFVPGLGLCSAGFAQAMRRGLRRKPRRKSAA